MKYFILTVLIGLFVSLDITLADDVIDDDINCVQPTVNDCYFELDDDDFEAIIFGNGYVAVPLQNTGNNATCLGVMDDDGTCDGGIRAGRNCSNDSNCPEYGCINDTCTTNKLAWSVDVIDTNSNYMYPNPCATTGAKWDFQCSENVEPGDFPAECQNPFNDDDDIAMPSVKCPVEFNADISQCELSLPDDDDGASPITPLLIGVSLSGKNLYNPASGGRQHGGKNSTRNGINQMGVAHCVPNIQIVPAN